MKIVCVQIIQVGINLSFKKKRKLNFVCLAEKFFATLKFPIVPVVLGRTNYSQLIPSSGFIDTKDFANITFLAQYLKQIRNDKEKYLSYFSWKQDYVWGVSQLLTPFCDLCLRLHLDSTPNVIDDIHDWWHGQTCEKPRMVKPL